jgi:hypothetical protein
MYNLNRNKIEKRNIYQRFLLLILIEILKISEKIDKIQDLIKFNNFNLMTDTNKENI